MTDYRKVHEGVADLHTTYELFKRHSDKPWSERTEELYAGEWWETTEQAYDNFLEMMPPIFQEYDCFGMSEALTGSVRSVFYRIPVDGQNRYFHANVKLEKRSDINEMRAAILNEIDPLPTPKI